MTTKTKRVYLVMNTKPEVAREIAHEVIVRSNPHDSSLVAKKLEEAGITEEVLVRYFTELQKAVAQFWHNQHNMTTTTKLKPHELRQMYLPLLYSVIFASVGNMKVGNYEYYLITREDDIPDREFLIETSSTLESLREYVRGGIGQIGVRNVTPQSSTMLTILTEIDPNMKTASIAIRDGASVDNMLSGYAALVGLSLVDEANMILYTGEDEANFRELVGSITQRDPDKTAE